MTDLEEDKLFGEFFHLKLNNKKYSYWSYTDDTWLKHLEIGRLIDTEIDNIGSEAYECNLKFRTSWDWLMKAVVDIKRTTNLEFNIFNDVVYVFQGTKFITIGKELNLFNSLYQSVIKSLKYLRQQTIDS